MQSITFGFLEISFLKSRFDCLPQFVGFLVQFNHRGMFCISLSFELLNATLDVVKVDFDSHFFCNERFKFLLSNSVFLNQLQDLVFFFQFHTRGFKHVFQFVNLRLNLTQFKNWGFFTLFRAGILGLTNQFPDLLLNRITLGLVGFCLIANLFVL